jgi:hypothetical protein
MSGTKQKEKEIRFFVGEEKKPVVLLLQLNRNKDDAINF